MQHDLVHQIRLSSVTRAVSCVVIIQWRVFQRVNKIAKRVHMLEKKRCEKKLDQCAYLAAVRDQSRFPHKYQWLKPYNQL